MAEHIAPKLRQAFQPKRTIAWLKLTDDILNQLQIWSDLLSSWIGFEDADDMTDPTMPYEDELKAARAHIAKLQNDVMLLENLANQIPEERFRIATRQGYSGSETTIVRR